MSRMIQKVIVCQLLGWLAAATAMAAEMNLAGALPGGGVITKNLVSLREARYNGIIKQNTDFSCGAAALATLLKYAYHMNLGEDEVLRGMMQVADPELVRTKGFSMLDIKKYVETLGLRGRGYVVTKDYLLRIKVPTLVLLDIKGYKHFVVLKKTTPERVYLADPALGNKAMALDEFLAGWNGVVFAVIGNGYDKDNALVRSAKSLSVRRDTLQPPIRDAEIFEFGFGHAGLLTN